MVRPLRIDDDTTLSYPIIDESEQLMVQINGSTFEPLVDIVSNYWPEYHTYLSRNHASSANKDIGIAIDELYNNTIEQDLDFRYQIGTYGYISPLKSEDTFGMIIGVTEYKSEFFFLHDEVQKYHFRHFDIKSAEPKELSGYKDGWITESSFYPVPGTEHGMYSNYLSWKCAREEYLSWRMAVQALEFKKIIDARGILFRDTCKQFLLRINKALRGKITRKTTNKLCIVKFNLPYNMWMYYIEPILSAKIQIEESTKIEIELCALEMDSVLHLDYTAKFYDEYCVAFKLNDEINKVIKYGDTQSIDDVRKMYVAEINKAALKTKRSKKKAIRKVKYYLCMNRCKLVYNTNTNHCVISGRNRKVRILANGQMLLH